MSFLNFISIRIGRKVFLNQFSKKIFKKQKFIKRKRNFHLQVIHNPTPPPTSPPPPPTSTPPPPPFQGIYVAGKPVRKPPPPPITITWIWDTDDTRDWLELPPEITLHIFAKLETVDILFTVSQVCSSWRNLSKQPILYRSIVIGRYDPLLHGKWLWKGFWNTIVEATHRSSGKLVQFYCANMNDFLFGNNLFFILYSSTSIKSLGLGLCGTKFIRVEHLVELIKHISSLEQLFLCCIGLQPIHVHDIGLSCPKLKYLQIGVFDSDADDKALQIGISMPCLRRLHLKSNNLTIIGFQAILNGCPHLEYMNIKGFHNVEGDLLKKQIRRIKSSTLLNKNDEFGEEHEFYLETTSDKQHKIEEEKEYEEETDYGALTLYKTPFVDYNDPCFVAP